MIYLGLGSNLIRFDGTKPTETISQAIDALPSIGLRVEKTSRLWSSAPVLETQAQSQPRYANAVVAVQDLQNLQDSTENQETRSQETRSQETRSQETRSQETRSQETENKASALSLLMRLLKLEEQFERVRAEDAELNPAPRTLDLDLLDWHGTVLNAPSLVLPHPKMHLRAFVLAPLAEVAPAWMHPVSAKTVRQLLDALQGHGQELYPLN